MAEQKETIILDFQVETGDVIAELEKTKKSIIGLKEQQAALNKAYKEGSITVDEYAQETVRVEQVMKKETQTYATLTKAVGAQTNSINALTAQNKALREERNNLDISTVKGAKRLEEINKQLDRNTEAITKNVSKLEQQKINIGNYASALDNVIPGFSSFTQGIQGSTTAARAFIATPLGAVIGAIGLAVAALTAYFKGSEEGQDKLAKITAVLNVGMQKLLVVFEKVGGALFDAVTGVGSITDKLGIFGVALDVALIPLKLLYEGLKLISDFSGLTKLVEETVKEGDAIAELYDKIEARENELVVLRAQTSAKVLALREKAITQEGAAKKKTIEEAIRLEKSLANEEKKNLDDKLIAFDLEAKATGALTEEQKAKRVELVAAIINAESEGAQSTIKFQKELEKLREEQVKLNAEVNEAIQEEIRLKDQLAQVNERLAQQTKTEIEETPAIVKGKIDVNAATYSLTKANNEAAKISKDEADATKLKNAQQLEANKLANQTKSLFKENTIAYKGIATAQATMNTYLGASEALSQKSTLPSPFDVIAKVLNVATVIATGLKTVASINGVSFASGGYTGDGGKYEPAGIVHKGEVVFNQRDVEMMGGPNRVNAMRPTFKGYADGGIVTAASTGPINQSFAFRSAMNKQPQIVASWKEATELNTRIQFKESLVTL